jgi:hypothetical protein
VNTLSRIIVIVLILGAPLADAGEKTDGVRTLYLIRHGEYDHADDRDPDVGKALVPLGVAQARILGAAAR